VWETFFILVGKVPERDIEAEATVRHRERELQLLDAKAKGCFGAGRSLKHRLKLLSQRERSLYAVH
jgi:hypothetical protein